MDILIEFQYYGFKKKYDRGLTKNSKLDAIKNENKEKIKKGSRKILYIY